MPNLTSETKTGSRQQRQESSNPSSSPTRGPADPDDETVTGSSKNTEDWTSSDLGLLKGNMADSDLDTASGDCLSCSDTDDISMWTTQKKYRKRVRASCKLSKRLDGNSKELGTVIKTYGVMITRLSGQSGNALSRGLHFLRNEEIDD